MKNSKDYTDCVFFKAVETDDIEIKLVDENGKEIKK